MTDDNQWQAPDSVIPPPAVSSGPAPVAPPTAAPTTPPPPPPRFVTPTVAAPGWTPPPKPGLIPLRPLTLGTILGAAFQTLRRNPGATLAPALLLSVLVALVQALGSAGFLTQYFGAVTDLGSGSGSFDSGSSAVPSGLVSGLVGILATSLVSGIFTLIVTAIIEGIVTLQVASSTLGSRLRLRSLWSRLAGRRGALIGWAFLSGGVALVSIGIVVGLLVLLGLSGSAGAAVAVLLGLLLGAGLTVLFAWLWIKISFVSAAIVLERASIRTSLRRSWALTRGAFWRTFGIRLLVWAMIYVATQIIAAPVSLVFTLGGSVLSPNGDTAGAATNSLVLSVVVTEAVTAVISAVGLVVSSATTALLYLDRRIRVEGLDLDLAAYVERRQSGETGLHDPYLPPAQVGAV